MLHRFSTLLCELFRTAETMSPEAYALELLRLLCKSVSCDVALLGEGIARLNGSLPATRLSLYNCSRELFALLCALASSGALPGMSRSGPGAAPASGAICAPAARAVLPRHSKLAGTDQLVFISTAAPAEQPQTWLALLRTPGRHAGAMDVDLVEVLWPHLLHALELNRHRALETCIAQSSAIGHALLDADYTIGASDLAFRTMFAREWPGLPVLGFPQRALRTLCESGRYDGKVLLLELSGRGERPLCLSRTPEQVASLTPAERRVAVQYARGSSCTEIADRLCVSANTVRTHLAHVFDKMGIHRKADLIRRLAPG